MWRWAVWRSLALEHRIAAGVVFVLLGAIGFLPLFGGPGYEQALASGVVLPAAAAIATSLALSRSSDMAPLACVVSGLAAGARLSAAAFLTALAHGLRVGLCDLWGGSALFALTAGFGSLMGGAWGALVAEACRGRRNRRLSCVLLAISAPLAGIVGSLARFYGSPMVFQFDPFFGYFSGTLYDTVVDLRPELWSYRAGSVTTLSGIALVASALTRTSFRLEKRPKLAFADRRTHRGAAARLVLGAGALVVSAVMAMEGPALGHWQTAATIARALGGRAAGARCDVVYPDSLLPTEAALLVQDCEQDLAADERTLGAHLEGRLTAYFFRDANEKRRLMGAAETSIAKPWRRELYVQLSGFPHPVLGHEVAHVVAGSFGRGPLRIAGAAGGLWPNPGLIEGVAVATSPDDDELTDAQWARAMLDLGILPRVERLFSLDFLGENAAKSYTVAGAFVEWVLGRWGASVVRAWYGGVPLVALTGAGWDVLDEAFRDSLRALAMPAEASSYARAKFERPSIWARRCPHAIDALNRDGDRCRDEHRFVRAAALYDGALARDPRDWHARFERARLDAFFGGDERDEARGRNQLARLAEDAQAPRTWRDRALEALADNDAGHGRDDIAVAAYRALAARTLDEDVGRTLDVKAQTLGDPSSRRALIDLLIGRPGRPVDPWVGALSLGAWADETHGSLAAYLVGKNLAVHGEYARAASWLDRSIEATATEAMKPAAPTPRPPGMPRIGRELLRQRVVCACALKDGEALERVRQQLTAPGLPLAPFASFAPFAPFAEGGGGGAGDGRKDWLLRFIARCAGYAH